MPKPKGQDTYQRRGWLQSQLDKFGTYTAISEATGIPAQTLNKWGIKHGISQRPRIDPAVKRRVIKLLEKDLSQQEIAKRVKVSKATVTRITREIDHVER